MIRFPRYIRSNRERKTQLSKRLRDFIREDIASVRQRDPAARTGIEILLVYPGLHAIWLYRIAHCWWRRGMKLPARLLSTLARSLTGIEIHPAATIGPGLFIDHGMGVVIGETAEIGRDVTMYHGVTLGGTSLEKGKRHPTVGDRVVIGAGAKILGNITIGSDSRIGANAVVVRDVPANSVVVGIPGHVIRRHIPHGEHDAPDMHHEKLPDVIGQRLHELQDRVAMLEQTLADLRAACVEGRLQI